MNNIEAEITKPGPSLLAVSIVPNKNMFYGYPHGSAMDHPSVILANQILDKTIDSKVLECSLKACTIKFNSALSLCITGADMDWTIDQKPIKRYTKINISTGQVLSGGFTKYGLCSYISFSKNFKIIDRTKLTFTEVKLKPLEKNVEVTELTRKSWLLINKGPEWNLLSQNGKESLISYHAVITPMTSRMGAYLDGESISLKTKFPEKSVCTFPGVIQLLPDGKLIVLNQDAQTTGGYPRVAYFDSDDLASFNQYQIGEKIKWRLIQ